MTAVLPERAALQPEPPLTEKAPTVSFGKPVPAEVVDQLVDRGHALEFLGGGYRSMPAAPWARLDPLADLPPLVQPAPLVDPALDPNREVTW